MILVDKHIKEYVEKNELIISGYNENHINSMSYDLTIDYIILNEQTHVQTYELQPGDIVYIKTTEQLKFPTNITGRIAEKNSRMRQGLKVDGPQYQPGHTTFGFLRVQNLSTKILELRSGMAIAQIIFEQLKDSPLVPYSEQPGASYNMEMEYRGLGNYKAEYEKQTKEKTN